MATFTTLTENFPSTRDAESFVSFTNDFTIYSAEVILNQPNIVRLWTDYEDPDFDKEEGYDPKDALIEYMMRYKAIAQLI